MEKREHMTGNVDDQLCVLGGDGDGVGSVIRKCNSTPLLRLSPQSCGMDKKHVMRDLVCEQNRKSYK